ncbi:sensor histidine kinase [Salinihabitans flavidus]|nr:ATP-binding protein [Salinihabitans flavidus]
MKLSRALALAGLFLLLGLGLYHLSAAWFRAGETTRAEGRLSLYRASTQAEIDRFSHLTFVLARDPFVLAALPGDGRETLNRRFAAVADRAGLEAVYLMDTTGLTIAANNAGQPGSFVGQNYAFRPYFKEAMAGRQGRFYGIGATTGRPGYFMAEAVTTPSGETLGVVAIKLDLGKLERSWQDSGEQVLLSNADGVVLLASDPDWRYRSLSGLSAAQRAEIARAQQFSDLPLDPLDWRPLPGNRADIGAERQIHLTSAALPHGWRLHYFASESPVRTRAWLAVVIAAVIAAIAVLVAQSRRSARIGAALRRSEAEEADLRQANARLAVEIEERRAAEARLERTRDELARASRLAALGRLAASVTHELGQPIAAMRNHLVAMEISGRAASLAKLSGLVERMEGITRQLKFFASPDPEAMGPVDLRDAIRGAATLIAANIEGADVHLRMDLPDDPVVVTGSRLRLEQVATNLMRNAVDAMQEAQAKELSVSLTTAGDYARLDIRDTGTGLSGTELSELTEPFTTTKPSGQGMGLGLAISADILRDHGGRMRARDRRAGPGAVFSVELPLAAATDPAPSGHRAHEEAQP